MVDLIEGLKQIIKPDKYEITTLSNMTAFIFYNLKDVSWAGFYLLKDGKLILGPFQGKVACTEISIGKGVCGTTAEKRQTIVVENVHQFPGHIACDSASNSEIVIPIFKKGELYGVLDLDSTILSRFQENEKLLLEKMVKVLEEKLNDY